MKIFLICSGIGVSIVLLSWKFYFAGQNNPKFIKFKQELEKEKNEKQWSLSDWIAFLILPSVFILGFMIMVIRFLKNTY